MYYYSNAATLTIGALPTSVSAVTVTHAAGGKGTQSDPYYGRGGLDGAKDRYTQEQERSENSLPSRRMTRRALCTGREKTASYIGVIENKTTQDGATITKTQYYRLTGPDSSKQYTVTGDALSPRIYCVQRNCRGGRLYSSLRRRPAEQGSNRRRDEHGLFAVATGLDRPQNRPSTGRAAANISATRALSARKLNWKNQQTQYSVFHRSENDAEIVLFGKKDE